MNYCTFITNYDIEEQIIDFFLGFPEHEKINNMLTQFRYIMKEESTRDYYISFNPDNLNLSAIQVIYPNYVKAVNLTMFLAEMEKAINALLHLEKLNLKNNPQITQNNPNAVAQIEEYVHGLLRKHTEYLINELSLSQYPKEVLFKQTEEFIKSL